MAKISREQLDAYLDDALSDRETAQVEQMLRESEPIRKMLQAIMQERDRGEHSIGANWRRERLSCPTHDRLGNKLLQVLDTGFQEFIDFHLSFIGCRKYVSLPFWVRIPDAANYGKRLIFSP